jgi:branched-chain amino acid transport system ATP-binding protein
LVEICKALVGTPRVLLFDEPGAGMSEIESSTLRERLIKIPDQFKAQLLLIDHDVELISATCEETLVLNFGSKLAMGKAVDVLQDPNIRQAYLGGEHE